MSPAPPFAQLPLRPNVCMLLYNHQYKLFVGERAEQPGIWQFPQGGIEGDGPLEESVIRELYEELGAEQNLFQITRQLKATHEYEWEEPPPSFKERWRGQSQTFWLVEYLGRDSDIQLDRFHQELSSWRWCNTHEVRELVEPRRLPGYMLPLREFEDFLTLRGEGLA